MEVPSSPHQSEATPLMPTTPEGGEARTSRTEWVSRGALVGIGLVAAGAATTAWVGAANMFGRAASTSLPSSFAPSTPEAATSMLRASSGQTASSKSAAACVQSDTALIYKYTIASSQPEEDAEWAHRMFGVKNWNISYACGRIGKTTAMQRVGNMSKALNFGLHFVWNDKTPTGPYGVDYWDSYFQKIHRESFASNRYNKFMDYSLVFYVPCGDLVVGKILSEDDDYLARKHTSPLDGFVWYTLVVSSPGSKTFEITTTDISSEWLEQLTVLDWEACGSAHVSSTYTKYQLDYWYTEAHGPKLSDYNDQHPVMMPIRANVAVPQHVEGVIQWYQDNIPAIGNSFTWRDDLDEQCDHATALLEQSKYTGFNFEYRFIHQAADTYENTAEYIQQLSVQDTETADDSARQFTIQDFVDYIEEVDATYTSINDGWSGWWDRHLGIQLKDCALDDYMTLFAAHNVSFHAHARTNAGVANADDQPTDHVWTGGFAGYGLEILGYLDYTFQSCYYAFEWCTWDSDPAGSLAEKSQFQNCQS